MKLVGIVGMPGSGKSELFKSVEFVDFEKFDDVLANKEANEQRIREFIKSGNSVLVSDIEFCDAEWREIFERNVGRKFDWIFFENAPWKCAVNCLHRFYSGHERPFQEEVTKILRLTRKYKPLGDARPVKQMAH